jgi:iron complex outermembrane receptor protein
MIFGAPNTLATRIGTWSLAPRIRLPFEFAGRLNTLVFGADVDLWDYDSTFSGFFNSHALALQRNRAFYAQDNVALTPDTRLTLGARMQRSENSVSEQLPVVTTVDQTRRPRAYEMALRHRLTPGFSMFGKIGTSFRVATVDENRFQVTLLEPQTSHDREMGAEAEWRNVRVRLALFRMDLENEIYFSPIFPPFGANINLSPTRREGLEIESTWQATPALSAFVNVALTSAKFREGTYGGVDVSGKDVPLVPRHVLSLGGAWTVAKNTEASLFARVVGAQRFDNDQANAFSQRIPSYATLDLKLAHAFAGWQFAATVRNVFDRKYFSYGIVNAAGTSFNAYPAPQRNAFFSAEYRFR